MVYQDILVKFGRDVETSSHSEISVLFENRLKLIIDKIFMPYMFRLYSDSKNKIISTKIDSKKKSYAIYLIDLLYKRKDPKYCDELFSKMFGSPADLNTGKDTQKLRDVFNNFQGKNP